ncbi:hypothetical protein ACFFX0_12070 [Citricoccus parietis]|uniref:Uncharacterized protein n=1 Tax=Citricoccus parietis TaxID=592307 RepID=A0ABV5FYZ2_9MICC
MWPLITVDPLPKNPDSSWTAPICWTGLDPSQKDPPWAPPPRSCAAAIGSSLVWMRYRWAYSFSVSSGEDTSWPVPAGAT